MKILRVELYNGSTAYLAVDHIAAMEPSMENPNDPENTTAVYYAGSDEPFSVAEPVEQLQARWCELL